MCQDRGTWRKNTDIGSLQLQSKQTRSGLVINSEFVLGEGFGAGLNGNNEICVGFGSAAGDSPFCAVWGCLGFVWGWECGCVKGWTEDLCVLMCVGMQK